MNRVPSEWDCLFAIAIEIQPAFLRFAVENELIDTSAVLRARRPGRCFRRYFCRSYLRIDPAGAVTDIAVNFVGVHFHVERIRCPSRVPRMPENVGLFVSHTQADTVNVPISKSGEWGMLT